MADKLNLFYFSMFRYDDYEQYGDDDRQAPPITEKPKISPKPAVAPKPKTAAPSYGRPLSYDDTDKSFQEPSKFDKEGRPIDPTASSTFV